MALCSSRCRGADHPHPGTAAAFAIDDRQTRPDAARCRRRWRVACSSRAAISRARRDRSAHRRRRDHVACHPARLGRSRSRCCPKPSRRDRRRRGHSISRRSARRSSSTASRVRSIVAVDAATGAIAWRVPFDATEFAMITSIAPLDDGGARRRRHVLRNAAGRRRRRDPRTRARRVERRQQRWLRRDAHADGARRAGSCASVVRGADAVQGVAARGDRIAIAGTFSARRRAPRRAARRVRRAPAVRRWLRRRARRDRRAPLEPDVRRQARRCGRRCRDRLASNASPSPRRSATRSGSAARDLAARGDGDGLVAWFSPAGEPGATTILGGTDFDGLRAIAAVDDRVVVAGFFSRRARARQARARLEQRRRQLPRRSSMPAASSRPVARRRSRAARRSRRSRRCPVASSPASRTPRRSRSTKQTSLRPRIRRAVLRSSVVLRPDRDGNKRRSTVC